ncbi:TPA: hypothetical protein DCW54_03115 [Candidatus Dependentiae bacterium]|nr:hypothetical protein [Candidatus Dependentiae bacterium]
MLVIFLLVQIIFESLPVSSSGHTMLFSLSAPKLVDFVAHLFASGVFLCYLFLRRQEVFSWWLQAGRYHWKSYGSVLLAVWGATILALAAKMTINASVAPPLSMLGFGFLLTSIVLLSLYRRPLHPTRSMVKGVDLFWLSAAQVVAFFVPGASRMGLVFATATWLGWSADAAWYWMIATAFPLFVGAGLLGALSGGIALITDVGGWTVWLLLLGAFGCSLLLFAGAAYLARTNRFWFFGFYTLALALVAFAYQWLC